MYKFSNDFSPRVHLYSLISCQMTCNWQIQTNKINNNNNKSKQWRQCTYNLLFTNSSSKKKNIERWIVVIHYLIIKLLFVSYARDTHFFHTTLRIHLKLCEFNASYYEFLLKAWNWPVICFSTLPACVTFVACSYYTNSPSCVQIKTSKSI